MMLPGTRRPFLPCLHSPLLVSHAPTAPGAGRFVPPTPTPFVYFLLLPHAMSRFPLALLLCLAPLLAAAQNAVSSCGPNPCPDGFACVTTEPGEPGQCVAVNPCQFADCGAGFFCDLDFALDNCNSEEVPGNRPRQRRWCCIYLPLKWFLGLDGWQFARRLCPFSPQAAFSASPRPFASPTAHPFPRSAAPSTLARPRSKSVWSCSRTPR